MALYSYVKSDIKYAKGNNSICKNKESLVSSSIEEKVFSESIKKRKSKLHKKRNIYLYSRNIFGLLLIFTAAAFFFPFVAFYFSQIFSNQFNQSFISPLSANSLSSSSAGISNPFSISSDPNSAYFSKAVSNMKSPTSNDNSNYSGKFYLSIPSVGLSGVPVQANVKSDDNSYLTVLSNSLAHFQGTALPDQYGNVFIYGHSSVQWFNTLFPHSFEGIFTPLIHVNIGDSINIKFKDKALNYEIYETKVINPDDFSVLQGDKNEKTLTLMTCVPPGVSTQRLIVKAIQEN